MPARLPAERHYRGGGKNSTTEGVKTPLQRGCLDSHAGAGACVRGRARARYARARESYPGGRAMRGSLYPGAGFLLRLDRSPAGGGRLDRSPAGGGPLLTC